MLDGKIAETLHERAIKKCSQRYSLKSENQGSSSEPFVLLLQGPVGPFFSALAKSIINAGYGAVKINFNGGDWLFNRGKHTLSFCGTIDEWDAWLAAFLTRSRPAAIVLFGDSRPYHSVAVTLGKRFSVPVWCLEEGYARPDFITCEIGGNNALSPLRALPANMTAAVAAEPITQLKGNLFGAMAVCAVPYYVAKAIGTPFFFGNPHHRNRSLFSEALLWTRGFWRKIAFYYSNHNFLQHLIENLEGKYYVVALQVHNDLQLLRHGKGWTMERLIAEAIQSFAAHAPVDRHLVLKVHPMDRGHRSYRKFATTIAEACQCGNRVHVVDDGSIGLMIRHSLGVVTVNSTSGLLALNRGKPLLVLGDAIYGQSRLATVGSSPDMDRFWRAPVPPDGRLAEFFTKRMHRESLINGSFYLSEWAAPTAARIFHRIKVHFDEGAENQSKRRVAV
jgi:capsular polysaccharide export protein